MPRASSPTLRGLLEAALYVTDVEAARDFYARVFGFRTLYADGRMCALDVDGRGVLLLFLRGASAEPVQLPGGILPPHDGRGTSHLAFAIDERDLSDWRDWLHAVGVEIESEVRWERGGRSLYFRDLDGHLLEVATPGLWETY